MMVSVSIGAWAIDFTGGSITTDGSGTTTVNITTAGSFGTWYSNLQYQGDDATYRAYISGNDITKIIVTGYVNSSDLTQASYNNNGSAVTYNFSGITSGQEYLASTFKQNNNFNKLLPSGENVSEYTGYYKWVAVANNTGTTEIYIKEAGALALALSEIGNDLQSNLKIYGDIYEADKTTLVNLTSISNLELSNVNIKDEFGNPNGNLDLSSVTYSYSSNSTVTSGSVTPPPSHDPYTISGNAVTINMDYLSPTYSNLSGALTAAISDLGETTIGSLTVTGEIDDTDLAALTGAAGATRIDLSGATIASGSSINNIALPASLTSLVLPEGLTTIPAALKSKFAAATNLWYAYSPTSQNQTKAEQTTSPDLVWVNKAGGLDKAIINEAKLRTAVYVKVESSVALNANDVDLATNNKQTGENTYENVSLNNISTDATNYAWQYIDMSGANLQDDVIVSYKAPQTTNSYRLILPDGWGPNRMSIIPSVKESNYGSGLAAVYSYTAQGFLQILEINDNAYNPGALADNRIVRNGTKAIRVVSGTYNETTYGVFGQLQADATKNNLFAAINGAAPSIEAVTITDVRTATNEPLTFTNKNLIYIQLDRVKSMYNQDQKTDGPIINVDDCTKLQTLNLLNSVLASVDASVPALAASGDDPSTTGLTAVNMSGTTVVGTTDLSTSPITNTGFVTNDDTWFKGDLNLSKTALTTFTTTAKVGTSTANTGNINLNENNLTGVSLNQVQFQNTSSIVYVRKAATDDPSTTEVDETKVLTGTLGDNSIIVPVGFDAEHRIVPYFANSVNEEQYVAPAYVFSATDMYLHEKETTGETPDKFVYWYTGTLQNNKVLTITMTDERRGTLATLLGSGNANITSSTELVRLKIVGPLASNDLAALESVNAQILDLSEATLQKESSGTYTDDVTILAKGSAINSNVKFLLLPISMIATENFYNTTTMKFSIDYSALETSFPGLYSAIALTDYNTSNAFDFVAYNKVAGTLQPAVIAAGRGTLNGSQMIRGEEGSERTAYYPTMSGNYNRSATISGLINAYDLSYGAKLDADGHLAFNKRYANESLDADDRTNVGTETKIQGAFSGSNGPRTLDLKAAEITGPEYINDICISYLVPTNMLKYLIIPETESVKETPSYFIQHNTVKEICIPSNIEVIRTHFAPSLDHIWTTSAGTSDLAGTVFDNGVIESATTTGSGDSQVVTQSDPVYGYTDFTFSGQYPVGTYTFSSNLKMIESHAFANTQPHVNDVYVLAKYAPECHVDAFCTAMYVGNGGYSPTIIGGVITRDSYVNGNNWIAMLHYPRECASPEVQRYTDPTRAYTTASNETDGKGGVLYYPNHGEFLAAYAQGTLGYLWNAWKRKYEFGMLQDSYSVGNDGWTQKHQANGNEMFEKNPDLEADPNNTKWTCTSFYDVTAGDNLTKPEKLANYYDVRWDEKKLYDGGTTGIQLYPQANTANTELSFNVNTNGTETDTSDDTKVTTRDYRGWHQFVLNAFAANTSVPVQPVRSYITDTDWWTICLPYDLTYNEMILFYGDMALGKVPQLYLLSNVVRNEGTHTITLNFSKNLMEYEATKSDDGVWTVGNKLTDNQKAGNDNYVVLHAGVPYLIKPTFTDTNRQFDVYDDGIDISAYTSLSEGRIKVSSNEYPGLYEKIKKATETNGAEFRELQEKNIYTVPALLPVDVTTTEEKVNEEPITVDGKQYYRSADFDYTFVGSLAKAIIPPYSYYLGVKNKKACFIYADYLKDGISTATKEKFQNTMRWNNNSCVICPNMLLPNDQLTTKQHYNLGHAEAHNGKITIASGKEAAQWKIYGANVTGILTDDVYHSANMDNTNAPMTMMFGMDMSQDYETTSIKVDGVEIMNTSNGNIYSLNGQYVGNSLDGLSKGVYIQNGKKIVVK